MNPPIQQSQIVPQESSFAIKDALEQYLSQWKWFVFSLGISLTIAFLMLRYAVPRYRAVISIMVKDERKGGLANELSAFADLGVLANIKSSVDNEIEILKSRSLTQQTVIALGLNISYVNRGRLKSEEIYGKQHFKIRYLDDPQKLYKTSTSFLMDCVSDSTFNIIYDNETKSKLFQFGQPIEMGFGVFQIEKTDSNSHFNFSESLTTMIRISPLASVVESYRGRLEVNVLNKNSTGIEVAFTDQLRYRAEDYLNNLIRIYNQNAVDDKNRISQNTSDFIRDRLNLITTDLEGVEKDAEAYKKENKVTDIKSEAGMYLENSKNFEKQALDIDIELKVVESVAEYVKNNTKFNLLPTNVINTDANYSSLIDQYNQLILERNRLLINAKANNPVVVNLDSKIETMNANILSSLARLKSTLEIKKKDFERQAAIVKGKISQIPTQEREVRVLARQQQIKESLYLYLLEKREEIAISLAVSAPNAKIIDPALASPTPISPNSRMILMVALLVGLLLPFVIIYANDLLDTKVKSRKDIEGKYKAPFLGEVPKSSAKGEIIKPNSRSAVAENLRIIRTYLDFIINQPLSGQGKTIFITSTLPNEGKTYLSVNLAKTIALSGKRVLLVGLDLRRPKFGSYLEILGEGITNYLVSEEESISNFIYKQEGFPHFYALPAGIVPPNPAELLMNPKIGIMFEQIKKMFDYIIVDTVPVGIVADTLLVANYADAFVYVIRANYVDRRLLNNLDKYYEDRKLPNLSLLLNGTENKNTYGYGEAQTKKSWFRRLFGKKQDVD